MCKLVPVVFVFLIYINGRGLGNIVPEPKRLPISYYMTVLPSKCTNQEIANELMNNLETCNLPLPSEETHKLDQQQILCLLHYDISLQLCQSPADIKTTDLQSALKNEYDLKDFCEEAETWTASNITWYPFYKSNIERIFKDKFECAALCPEKTNMDYINSECKLYKVGYNLLVPSGDKPTQTSNVQPVSNANPKFTVSASQEEPTNILHRESVPQTMLTRDDINKAYQGINAITTPVKQETANLEIKPDINNKEKLVMPQDSITSITNTAKIETSLPNDHLENPNKSSADLNQKPLEVTAQHVPKEQVPLVGDKPVAHKQDNPEEQDNSNLEDPDDDPNAPQEKMYESEEEPFPYQQKGQKTEEEKLQITKQEHSKPVHRLPVSEKATFPNMDGFPDDDEDHFFSFFLSMIVIVVLLYVVYHNKAKISKLVLGLMIEGRQTDRRRNSRGHAYKRLDNLEHAMSSTSDAPPSKIIY